MAIMDRGGDDWPRTPSMGPPPWLIIHDTLNQPVSGWFLGMLSDWNTPKLSLQSVEARIGGVLNGLVKRKRDFA